MGDTSIRVSEELAEELYQRKGRATSYEEFLWELLERVDAGDGEEEAAVPARDTPPEPQQHGGEGHRPALRGELAGSGEVLERRVDAVLSMYDVLRDRGQAEKDELLDAVDIDATGYASRESVWSNMVKGCDTLRALPGVEPPSTGRSEWRYRP